ncbi:14257_t:CDS:2 [Funneliformis mosseae]|uniref:14257_t:CDS:1 n=1 Tax=Funneliformis mosseae TaxID=27381 RepID=A0A9N8VRM6_FUNMO|nr:14257_t:CDS:2 [Funneliformis mosseae]
MVKVMQSSKSHDKLDCLIFVLRNDEFYHKIFPLTVMDQV